MTKKLEELTEDQKRLIPILRDEWVKLSFCGDTSINCKVAAEGIRLIYWLAKLESPFLIFVRSPMECQMAVWFLKACLKNRNLVDQVMEQVGAQVGEQVWAQVWEQVMAQVRAQVWAQVKEQVGEQVGAQVGEQVMAQVRAQVKEQVREQVGEQVREQVGEQEQYFSDFAYRDLGGDSGWVAFYDYFDRIGIKITGHIKLYRDYIKSGVFMTIFLRGFAICCPRPKLVKRDENNRLHNDSGPSIEFENGEKYWMWHGSRVSEKIIMRPKEITKEEIATEKNSEVSRAIAERLGWDEYMKRAGTILVDKWFDTDKGLHYELWDFKNRFEMTPKLLKMESPVLKDGTMPFYIEPVDPGLKTCQAARAWQFMKIDGTWPTVKEANDTPELVFGVEA